MFHVAHVCVISSHSEIEISENAKQKNKINISMQEVMANNSAILSNLLFSMHLELDWL